MKEAWAEWLETLNEPLCSRTHIREHFLTPRDLGEARTAGEKSPENADPIKAMVISPE